MQFHANRTRTRGESDRLLNYRCLAARCLIIALTPSRNTGRGVILFFFLRAFTKHTWTLLLRQDCDAQRRLESDFAISRFRAAHKRLQIAARKCRRYERTACQGRLNREFLSFSPRELSPAHLRLLARKCIGTIHKSIF